MKAAGFFDWRKHVSRYVFRNHFNPLNNERFSFMTMTFQFFPRSIVGLLFICSCCFTLTLLSGCGGGTPKLTPAEQADVDGYIMLHGTDAIAHYLESVSQSNRNEDEKRVLKYLNYLVSQGADVNAKIEARRGSLTVSAREESTPLQTAVKMGSIDIVKFLVSKGADVNVSTDDSWSVTPLGLAAEMGNDEIAKFLVSKGATERVRVDDDETVDDDEIVEATHWSTPIVAFLFGEELGNFYDAELLHNRPVLFAGIIIAIVFAYVTLRITYAMAKKSLTKSNRKTQKDVQEKEKESA